MKEGSFDKVTHNGAIDLHRAHHHKHVHHHKENGLTTHHSSSIDEESDLSHSYYESDYDKKSFINEDELSVSLHDSIGKNLVHT